MNDIFAKLTNRRNLSVVLQQQQRRVFAILKARAAIDETSRSNMLFQLSQAAWESLSQGGVVVSRRPRLTFFSILLWYKTQKPSPLFLLMFHLIAMMLLLVAVTQWRVQTDSVAPPPWEARGGSVVGGGGGRITQGETHSLHRAVQQGGCLLHRINTQGGHPLF